MMFSKSLSWKRSFNSSMGGGDVKGVRMAERTQSRSVPLWETWTFDVCKPFCSPVGVSPNKGRDGSSLDPRQVWGRLIHETAGGGRHRLLVPSKATPLLQHPTTPLFSQCFAKDPPVTSHSQALVVGIDMVPRPQAVCSSQLPGSSPSNADRRSPEKI